MKNSIDKIRLLKRLILAFIIALTVGLYLTNKVVKNYGYTSVYDLIKTYKSNSNLSTKVEPEIISINLSDADYKVLCENRQVALDRGLQINNGDNYVNCEVNMNGEHIKGKMRLKGHMTDHLEGDKWSFRVKTKNKVLGMNRFSLQHPGTRNFIYEWIYHELLKNEDVIYLKYDFVNLKLNNKDLGIYAIEEHFGQHILERNNRPKGAILRWNPSLYWESRIDEFQKIYLDQEYSNFESSFAEPYDKGVVLKDQKLIDNYYLAASKLELFRRGELSTSEVFDIDKLAKFHAIIDLVGGHHSLDWSDVKFYYNSETEKIEPVGYESFSIRESKSIAGQQIPNNYDKVKFNYHAQLFSDPIFFEKYINELERIADESYIDAFFEKIKEELDLKRGIIGKEWAYRKFGLEGYFENIRLIRNNLNLPKPCHAFVEFNSKDSLVLNLTPVSDFPIKIMKIENKGKETTLVDEYILPAKARKSVAKYFRIVINGNFEKIKGITILAKIPGSSKTFNVGVENYPSCSSPLEKLEQEKILLDTSIVTVNDGIIRLKNKHTDIKSKFVIPEDYNLVIYSGQTIELQKDIIVEGQLSLHGFKESLVKINTIGDANIKVFGTLSATNVEFSGANIIESINAELGFERCLFYDIEGKLISDYQSTINMSFCAGGNVNSIGDFVSTEGYFNENVFTNGKLAFNSIGSFMNIRRCDFKKYDKILNGNSISQTNFWSSEVSGSDTLFELSNTSSCQVISCNFSSFEKGFIVNGVSPKLQGKSNYTYYKTSFSDYKDLEIHL